MKTTNDYNEQLKKKFNSFNKIYINLNKLKNETK